MQRWTYEKQNTTERLMIDGDKKPHISQPWYLGTPVFILINCKKDRQLNQR